MFIVNPDQQIIGFLWDAQHHLSLLPDNVKVLRLFLVNESICAFDSSLSPTDELVCSVVDLEIRKYPFYRKDETTNPQTGYPYPYPYARRQMDTVTVLVYAGPDKGETGALWGHPDAIYLAPPKKEPICPPSSYDRCVRRLSQLKIFLRSRFLSWLARS